MRSFPTNMYDIQPTRMNDEEEEDDGKAITYVKFLIHTANKTCNEISALLDLDYTSCYEIGDRLSTNSNHVLNKTSWLRNSKNFINSPKIYAHLKWLLDSLHGKLPAIRQLQNEGAKMQIILYLLFEKDSHSVDLPREIIDKLSTYRIDLEFYFHHIGKIEK